jgi:hypothetical protein
MKHSVRDVAPIIRFSQYSKAPLKQMVKVGRWQRPTVRDVHPTFLRSTFDKFNAVAYNGHLVLSRTYSEMIINFQKDSDPAYTARATKTKDEG